MVELTYYGHSTFMLKAGKTALVVDPFFTGNTWQIAQADDIRCDYIFVSHGHDDHYGDSGCIGKANDALFISTPEVVKELAEKDGLRSDYLHLGGKVDYPFGCIRLVPAVTIPVHYGTWPIIEGDPLEFVDRLYKEYGQEGLHVKPGMKIIL